MTVKMLIQTIALFLTLASSQARQQQHHDLPKRDTVTIGPFGTTCPAIPTVTVTIQPTTYCESASWATTSCGSLNTTIASTSSTSSTSTTTPSQQVPLPPLPTFHLRANTSNTASLQLANAPTNYGPNAYLSTLTVLLNSGQQLTLQANGTVTTSDNSLLMMVSRAQASSNGLSFVFFYPSVAVAEAQSPGGWDPLVCAIFLGGVFACQADGLGYFNVQQTSVGAGTLAIAKAEIGTSVGLVAVPV